MSHKHACIVVWGASGGVGRALVQSLCSDGTNVIAYTRHEEDLALLLKEYPSLVVRKFRIAEEFYRAEKAYLEENDYHVQGMVDCVGSTSTQADSDLTQHLVEVMMPNLYHQYLSSLIFKDILAVGSSIVYISSIRAKTGIDNANIEYAFAKAALENMAKSFVYAFKDRQIRVNVIRPTPILQTKLSQNWSPELIEKLTDKSVYGKLLTPKDVVSVARFLLAEESSGITGSVIDVTNGFAELR